MKAWLGSAALAALLAAAAPALAQNQPESTGMPKQDTAGQKSMSQPTAAPPADTTSGSGASTMSSSQPIKKRSPSAKSSKSAADNATTEQLNQEELQRLQQQK
jgi:hypothetical protein